LNDRMKKIQLSIYLDPQTFRALEAFAKRRGQPKSLVAEAAIASFLSPDDSDRREAAIAKRLDRIVRVLERLERNDGVTLETIALFIRFWLTSTPALPEQSSPPERAKGAERYDRFVEALGRRISSGASVLKEVALDIPPSANTSAEDARSAFNQPFSQEGAALASAWTHKQEATAA
jgi:predicted transcriptional regulator